MLILTLAICWSLIAVLQYFLSKSQRDQGVIFAPSISDLPLRRTFIYQYFPTIVAVIFSIYWAWIDLETKRMEPYYQLSKENGALGKDSLLLHYPFDFIPLVPLNALRSRYVCIFGVHRFGFRSFNSLYVRHLLIFCRHWPVFWASLTVLVVTWGLVPVQAGIFTTRTITQSTTIPFQRSTTFVPANEQLTNLTIQFTQTTYEVAVLNEKLTRYMARNYTVAPIRPSPKAVSSAAPNGNWTAPTTMYSLDLSCEPAAVDYVDDVLHWANSTDGCQWDLSINGNLTIGTSIFQNLFGFQLVRFSEYIRPDY